MQWKFTLSIGFYRATQEKVIDLDYLNETEESWASYTEAEQRQILNAEWEMWVWEHVEGGYEDA